MSYSGETGEQVIPQEPIEEEQTPVEHTTEPTVEEDQPAVHVDTPQQAEARQLNVTVGRVTHIASDVEEPPLDPEVDPMSVEPTTTFSLAGTKDAQDVGNKDN